MVLKSDNNLDIHHVIHVLNIFVFIKKIKIFCFYKSGLKPLIFRIKLNYIVFSLNPFTIQSHVYKRPFFLTGAIFSFSTIFFAFFLLYFLILVKKSNTCTRNCFNQFTNLTELFKYTYTYNVQWNSETSYQTCVNHAYTVTISYRRSTRIRYKKNSRSRSVTV